MQCGERRVEMPTCKRPDKERARRAWQRRSTQPDTATRPEKCGQQEAGGECERAKRKRGECEQDEFQLAPVGAWTSLCRCHPSSSRARGG